MILFASSGLCVIFLLLHSLYFRPLRATLLILGFCLPLSALYGNLYDFKENVAVIPFGYGIPAAQIVGFFFAFYCALTIATHIVEERDGDGNRIARYYPLLVWTVFITIFIGLGIEYANFTIKWWTWRPGVTVGKIMLVGVWGWRPLLGMPLLLQFFISRDFHVKLKRGRTLMTLGVLLFAFATAASISAGKLNGLFSVLFIVAAVLFILYTVEELINVAGAVMRHRRMRIVAPLCLLWFIVFLTWMIYVDRKPFLQAMTLPLWLALPPLTRIKSPVISLDRLMYDTPRPLFGRNRDLDIIALP